jgi:hypothetical protein
MQQALDHLVKHKVYVESLDIDMIPLTEAYKAVQLSVDQQLLNMTTTLENSLGKLGVDLTEIQKELENDQNSTRESEIDI